MRSTSDGMELWIILTDGGKLFSLPVNRYAFLSSFFDASFSPTSWYDTGVWPQYDTSQKLSHMHSSDGRRWEVNLLCLVFSIAYNEQLGDG